MQLPDGWLTDEEAAELQRLAAGLTVLELGAWKGRSTVAMAQVARYVVSVDRHQGIPPAHLDDSLPEYLQNVRHLPNVAVVVASFDDFVPLLGRFEMVFVDGNHDANAVGRDVLLAMLVAPEVVAFHDWDFPEVKDTVEAFFGCPADTVVGSVASYQHLRYAAHVHTHTLPPMA